MRRRDFIAALCAAERTSEQVAALQTSLAEMLKYLRWIATAITVIAVYLMVISFIKK